MINDHYQRGNFEERIIGPLRDDPDENFERGGLVNFKNVMSHKGSLRDNAEIIGFPKENSPFYSIFWGLLINIGVY